MIFILGFVDLVTIVMNKNIKFEALKTSIYIISRPTKFAICWLYW